VTGAAYYWNPMDWSVFHWLNDATRGSDPGQDTAQIFNAWAIFVLVAVAGGLWLLARPGGSLRWKLAAASAALSAVIGLAVNAALGSLWYDTRPFVGHPAQTVLLIRHGPDNGFPSEHATVAFAVAFAVVAFSRPLGALLVVGAAAIALDRIFVGVHYPADLLASLGVGLCSALLVTTMGRPYVTRVVRLISRATDPVLAALGRLIAPSSTRSRARAARDLRH
jgi:undecaprenyl-diphosphatase